MSAQISKRHCACGTTVLGMPCIGLNGGPAFKHFEAFSFQVATDSQEETDLYWNAIVGNDCKESSAAGARTSGPIVVAAMMTMKKIDVAAIEAEVRADFIIQGSSKIYPRAACRRADRPADADDLPGNAGQGHAAVGRWHAYHEVKNGRSQGHGKGHCERDL